MGHDPNVGHWVFCLGHEPIYKNIYNNIHIQYIIVYIIRLRLSLIIQNKIVHRVMVYFKFKVVNKRVTTKKGWEPLM